MKKIFGLLLVVAISIGTILPLFHSGYFPMHDDTQVARVIGMGNALRNGQFPVRWIEGLGYGYGYPLFQFYGPLPYYVGGFIASLGVGAVLATKIMFGIGVMLAPVVMYLFLSPFVGVLGAVVGALVYTFAPYHAVQVYVRGSVGEYWTLIFMPLILYGLIHKNKQFGGAPFLLGVLGVAGVVLSHTIIGFVTIVTVFAMLVLSAAVSRMKHRFVLREYLSLGSIVVLGLGVSAFFWLPAFVQMNYTNVMSQIGPTSNFRDHFVCLSQLWDSPWGYGGSAVGCTDGLTFKLGKIAIILSAIAFIIPVLKKKRTISPVLATSLILLLVSIVLMLPVSQPFWEQMFGFSYIQYPWRFLTFAIFALAIGGGYAFTELGRLKRFVLTVITIVLLLINQQRLFAPQYLDSKIDRFTTAEDIQFRASSLSDEYLPPSVPRPSKPDDLPGVLYSLEKPVKTVEITFNKENYKKLFFDTDTAQNVTFYRAYFPGWRYYINEREIVPTIKNGFPTFQIPSSRNAVELRFTNTPIVLLGNTVSILSLLLLLYKYGKKTIA